MDGLHFCHVMPRYATLKGDSSIGCLRWRRGDLDPWHGWALAALTKLVQLIEVQHSLRGEED
jgi:hypothetical protein